MVISNKQELGLKSTLEALELGEYTVEIALEKIVEIIREVNKENAISIMTTVIMQAYDYNYEEISRDWAKILLMQPEVSFSHKERIDFFRIIMQPLRFYCQGDFSEFSNFICGFCAKHPEGVAQDEEDLPFE